MEQLCITKQMKEELTTYLEKHEGHSARIVVSTLKGAGVDMQAYFSGNILGNHCIIFGKRGDLIIKNIDTEFSPYIKDTKNKEYLEDFLKRMKKIIDLWYKIECVVKSAKLQTDVIIEQFEKDTNELRESIFELVEKAEAIGMDIKLPKKSKTHILFDGHFLGQLRRWGTIGGLDEQSIESAHAVWNALMRQFGTTRGWRKKEQVLREFLCIGATFIHDSLDEMIRKTMRVKGARSGGKWKSTSNENTEEAEEKENGDNGDEDIDPEPLPELSDLEKKINESRIMHPDIFVDGMKADGFDTNISVCPCCKKRLLSSALRIHAHEAHSGTIVFLKEDSK